MCKIDAFLAAARSMTPETRSAEARLIINHIMASGVPERDGRDKIWVWEYFLGRWAELFEELGASDIATSIDETGTDGGFAEARCGFYNNIAGLPAFVAHYKTRDMREVVDCRDPELPGGPLDVTRQPRKLARARRVTACEADRQVARLRTLTGGARRSAVSVLIEQAGEDKPADEVGNRYLNQVAGSVFQHPDEAVFEALDAATKRNPTKFICQLYRDATWSKAFGPRYRRPDRRALIRPCEKDEDLAADFERVFAR